MNSRSAGELSKHSSFAIESLNFPVQPARLHYDTLSGVQVHHNLVSPATASPKTSPVLSNRKSAAKSSARPFQRLSERLDQLSSRQIESSTRRLSQHVNNRLLPSRHLNYDHKEPSLESFGSPKHPMSFHLIGSSEDLRVGSCPKDGLDDYGMRSPHAVQSRGSKGIGVDLETGASHMVRLTPVGHTYVQYAVRSQPYVSNISEVVTSRAEVAKLRAAADQAAAWARDNAALREQVRILQAELSDAKNGDQTTFKKSDFDEKTGEFQSSKHGMGNADGTRSVRSQDQGMNSSDGTRRINSSQQFTSKKSGHPDEHSLSQREATVSEMSLLRCLD